MEHYKPGILTPFYPFSTPDKTHFPYLCSMPHFYCGWLDSLIIGVFSTRCVVLLAIPPSSSFLFDKTWKFCFCASQLWICMRLTFIFFDHMPTFSLSRGGFTIKLASYWKSVINFIMFLYSFLVVAHRKIMIIERRYFSCFTTCLIEWNESSLVNRWHNSLRCH